MSKLNIQHLKQYAAIKSQLDGYDKHFQEGEIKVKYPGMTSYNMAKFNKGAAPKHNKDGWMKPPKPAEKK